MVKALFAPLFGASRRKCGEARYGRPARANLLGSVRVRLETAMAKRNSPNDIKEIDDLNRLGEIVVDKRNTKRADARKSRRNRHYDKQFIKEAIKDDLYGSGVV